jgi:hypothetical protein
MAVAELNPVIAVSVKPAGRVAALVKDACDPTRTMNATSQHETLMIPGLKTDDARASTQLSIEKRICGAFLEIKRFTQAGGYTGGQISRIMFCARNVHRLDLK